VAPREMKMKTIKKKKRHHVTRTSLH